MRASRALGGWLVVVTSLAACHPSVAGRATGQCNVVVGGYENAPPTNTGGERTDPVELQISNEGSGRVRVQMRGCDLHGERREIGPNTNPHFVFTSGRCTWDLPGLGATQFEAHEIPRDPGIQDGPPGNEAYMNVTDLGEVFLAFESNLPAGRARFQCTAQKQR